MGLTFACELKIYKGIDVGTFPCEFVHLNKKD
jgi:hypothetical protein